MLSPCQIGFNIGNSEQQVINAIRALLENLPQDNWYASCVIHRSVMEFAKAQGIEMEQALTRKRLGTLMTNMGLYADKVRRTISGNKVRVYYVERSTLERVAENYEVSR